MTPAKTKRPVVVTFGDERLPLRFWEKVSVSDDGCWLWTAALGRGYGRYRVGGKGSPMVVPHRLLYVTLVAKVDAGLQLDHLCRVRRCVNPDHLEPVTPRTNTLRGQTPAAANASKTHCPQGHEYNEANTQRVNGQRHCRPCKTAQMRALRARRAAA